MAAGVAQGFPQHHPQLMVDAFGHGDVMAASAGEPVSLSALAGTSPAHSGNLRSARNSLSVVPSFSNFITGSPVHVEDAQSDTAAEFSATSAGSLLPTPPCEDGPMSPEQQQQQQQQQQQLSTPQHTEEPLTLMPPLALGPAAPGSSEGLQHRSPPPGWLQQTVERDMEASQEQQQQQPAEAILPPSEPMFMAAVVLGLDPSQGLLTPADDVSPVISAAGSAPNSPARGGHAAPSPLHTSRAADTLPPPPQGCGEGGSDDDVGGWRGGGGGRPVPALTATMAALDISPEELAFTAGDASFDVPSYVPSPASTPGVSAVAGPTQQQQQGASNGTGDVFEPQQEDNSWAVPLEHVLAVDGGVATARVFDTPGLRSAFLTFCGVLPQAWAASTAAGGQQDSGASLLVALALSSLDPTRGRASGGGAQCLMTAAQFAATVADTRLMEPHGPIAMFAAGESFAGSQQPPGCGALGYSQFLAALGDLAARSGVNVAQAVEDRQARLARQRHVVATQQQQQGYVVVAQHAVSVAATGPFLSAQPPWPASSSSTALRSSPGRRAAWGMPSRASPPVSRPSGIPRQRPATVGLSPMRQRSLDRAQQQQDGPPGNSQWDGDRAGGATYRAAMHSAPQGLTTGGPQGLDGTVPPRQPRPLLPRHQQQQQQQQHVDPGVQDPWQVWDAFASQQQQQQWRPMGGAVRLAGARPPRAPPAGPARHDGGAAHTQQSLWEPRTPPPPRRKWKPPRPGPRPAVPASPWVTPDWARYSPHLHHLYRPGEPPLDQDQLDELASGDLVMGSGVPLVLEQQYGEGAAAGQHRHGGHSALGWYQGAAPAAVAAAPDESDISLSSGAHTIMTVPGDPAFVQPPYHVDISNATEDTRFELNVGGEGGSGADGGSPRGADLSPVSAMTRRMTNPSTLQRASVVLAGGGALHLTAAQRQASGGAAGSGQGQGQGDVSVGGDGVEGQRGAGAGPSRGGASLASGQPAVGRPTVAGGSTAAQRGPAAGGLSPTRTGPGPSRLSRGALAPSLSPAQHNNPPMPPPPTPLQPASIVRKRGQDGGIVERPSVPPEDVQPIIPLPYAGRGYAGARPVDLTAPLTAVGSAPSQPWRPDQSAAWQDQSAPWCQQQQPPAIGSTAVLSAAVAAAVAEAAEEAAADAAARAAAALGPPPPGPPPVQQTLAGSFLSVGLESQTLAAPHAVAAAAAGLAPASATGTAYGALNRVQSAASSRGSTARAHRPAGAGSQQLQSPQYQQQQQQQGQQQQGQQAQQGQQQQQRDDLGKYAALWAELTHGWIPQVPVREDPRPAPPPPPPPIVESLDLQDAALAGAVQRPPGMKIRTSRAIPHEADGRSMAASPGGAPGFLPSRSSLVGHAPGTVLAATYSPSGKRQAPARYHQQQQQQQEHQLQESPTVGAVGGAGGVAAVEGSWAGESDASQAYRAISAPGGSRHHQHRSSLASSQGVCAPLSARTMNAPPPQWQSNSGSSTRNGSYRSGGTAAQPLPPRSAAQPYKPRPGIPQVNHKPPGSWPLTGVPRGVLEPPHQLLQAGATASLSGGQGVASASLAHYLDASAAGGGGGPELSGSGAASNAASAANNTGSASSSLFSSVASSAVPRLGSGGPADINVRGSGGATASGGVPYKGHDNLTPSQKDSVRRKLEAELWVAEEHFGPPAKTPPPSRGRGSEGGTRWV